MTNIHTDVKIDIFDCGEKILELHGKKR